MYFQQTQQMESLISLYDSGCDDVEQVEKPESQLVRRVSDTLIEGEPRMNIKQVQHTLFVRQMLREGEIDKAEYFRKMSNLFPERMENLPAALLEQIEQSLAVSE